MIRVLREPGLGLRVWGHACSAPAGQDLVCAGVSALVITLCSRVKELERAGAASPRELTASPGYASIRCEEGSGQLREAFDTVTAGLRLLSGAYPEYVVFEYGKE